MENVGVVFIKLQQIGLPTNFGNFLVMHQTLTDRKYWRMRK